MRLPENLRDQLKIPLGKLLPEAEVSKEKILNQIPADSVIITVGDITTEKMVGFGLTPLLQIIDGREKRKKRKALVIGQVNTSLDCDNPPAQITTQSIDTIKQAFKSKPPVRITVNGEEDLLVIPVCIYAPLNSVVMYGQPDEGLVIVVVNPETKNKTQSILDSMN